MHAALVCPVCLPFISSFEPLGSRAVGQHEGEKYPVSFIGYPESSPVILHPRQCFKIRVERVVSSTTPNDPQLNTKHIELLALVTQRLVQKRIARCAVAPTQAVVEP